MGIKPDMLSYTSIMNKFVEMVCFVVTLLIYVISTASTALGAGAIVRMDKETCSICQIENCKYVDVASFQIPETDKRLFIYFGEMHGAQNGEIDVYLVHGSECRCVLSGEGSGASFIQGTKKPYPDIKIHWHMSTDSGPITEHTWDGNQYKQLRDN
jgi:hypothetical protein